MQGFVILDRYGKPMGSSDNPLQIVATGSNATIGNVGLTGNTVSSTSTMPTQVVGTMVGLANGASYTTASSAANTADGVSANGWTMTGAGAYNGATWDRVRNNTQGTLLASAARTASAVSPTQTNYNANGILVGLNVTAASGTGGLVVQICAIDPISGQQQQLNANATPIIANGYYGYMLYPGATQAGTAGNNHVQQYTPAALPRSYQIEVFHQDGSSYTYSVSQQLIN